jgi:hypothetical protein
MDEETTGDSAETGSPPVRIKREDASESRLRRFFLLLDVGLIGLLALAIVLLINPLPRWVTAPAAGAALSLPQVLAYRGGAPLIGLLLLTTALIGGRARVRSRVAGAERLRSLVCPVCGSDDLRRVHRRWYHHLPGWLGVPVRRYVCANCRWTGARITRGRY